MENVCKQSQDSSRTVSGRADKDFTRTCPSNLSKRDLEDLYYSLFENNIQLKKDLNIQQDKVKVLSTKLCRFNNAQKKNVPSKNICKCVVHDIVEEQRIRIQDLELENSNLLERIKLLKMRLYSHKQFSRPITSRSQVKIRSISAEPSIYGSRRNLPTSLREVEDKYGLCDSKQPNKKRLNFSADQGLLDSETNLIPEHTSKEHVSVQVELGSIENKLLQEQISSLQKQLLDSEMKHKDIIANLERQVKTLEEEKEKLVTQNGTNQRKREMQYEATSAMMTDQVREAVSSNTKLAMELLMERKKIAELQKQLNAEELGRNVQEIVQQHLRDAESSRQKEQPTEFWSDNLKTHKEKDTAMAGHKEDDLNVIKQTVESFKHYFVSKANCQDSSSQTESETKEEKATHAESEVNEKQLIAVNKNLVAKINQLQNEFDELKVQTTFYEFPDDLPKERDEKCNRNRNLSEVELADIHPTTQPSTEQMVAENSNRNRNDSVSGRYYENSSKENVSFNNISLQRDRSYRDLQQLQSKVLMNSLHYPSNINYESKEVESFTENRADNETPFSEIQEPSTTKSDNKTMSTDSFQPRAANKLHESSKSLLTTVKSKEYRKSNELNENSQIHPAIKNKMTKHLSTIKSGGGHRKISNDKIRTSFECPQINNDQKLLQTGGNGKSSQKTEGPNELPALSRSQGRRASIGKTNVVSEMNDTQNPSTSKGTYNVDSKRLSFSDEKTEGEKEENENDENIIANDDVPNKPVQNDSLLPYNGESGIKQPEESNNTYTIDGMRVNNQIVNDVTSDSSGKTGRDVQSLPEESALLTDEKCDTCTDDKCLFDMNKCENSACITIHNGMFSETDDRSNNDVLYSEGEVPTDFYTLRKKEEALTAAKQRLDDISTQTRNKEDSTSLKVEEALKAITIELSKCRALLEASSPKKKSVSTTGCNGQNKRSLKKCLRASKAVPTISNALAPVANFNMHVGKIVFSDEALMNSEEIKLFVHWNFYKQPTTLIPVKLQRVVDLNFLVEYKLMLTEDFIKYLRNSTFIIMLCEIWKTDIPFAKCKVPLKKVLKNPGKRVNFFLGMFDEISSDSLKRIEVGVIDVWCSLSFREEYREHFNDLVTREHAQESLTSKLSLRTKMDQFRANSMMLLNKKDNATSKKANIVLDDPSQQITEDDVPTRKNMLSISNLSSVNESTMSKYSETNEIFRNDMRRLSEKNQGTQIQKDRSLYDVIENENWNRMVFQRPSNLDKPDDSYVNNKLSINGGNTETAGVIDHRRAVRIDQKLRNGMISGVSSTNSGFKANNEDAMSLFAFLSQDSTMNERPIDPTMDELIVTVLWLAFNEDSDVMQNPKIFQIYVAYKFLGLFGANLETPLSLPKPLKTSEKMYFNFRRSFPLNDIHKQILANMSRQFSTDKNAPPGNCINFSIISEPHDPGGQENCEDIGRVSLYFGDILLCCHGDHYMEVIPVKDINDNEVIIGVLAVKIDGVDVIRRINRTTEINI